MDTALASSGQNIWLGENVSTQAMDQVIPFGGVIARLHNFVPPARQQWTLGWGRADLVSVVVPVYNRADLIQETLDSVARQTYRPLELVIVDDGSSDDSVQAIQKWVSDAHLTNDFTVLLFARPHGGAPKARNYGIRASSGEYLQFLDSDDVLSPRKIEIQVEALRVKPTADFAYGRIFDLETGSRLMYGHTEMSPERMILKQINSPSFTTLGPVCRRRMIDGLGPWDETLPMCQDWEYHSRAVVSGFRGIYTPTATALVREDATNRLSWRFEKARADAWYQARVRQLGSMWFHAPPELRRDRRFRSALAWGLATATARAVKIGCQVDDHAAYMDARQTAHSGPVHVVTDFARRLRTYCGPRSIANFLLGLSWLHHRTRGARNRIGTLGFSWIGRSLSRT